MNSLKRFRSQCKGSAAVIFAIAVLPLMVGAGLALDYTRAVSRRTSLQNALDGAILAATRDTGSLTDAELAAQMKAFIEASEFGPIGDNYVSVSRAGTTMTASVPASVPTTLMKLAGIDEVNISATTKASWDTADVVLVLDNSGSMSVSSRMAMLRTAANDFIDQVGGTDSAVQIALAPFAQGVRVDRATFNNATWIDFSNNDSGAESYEDGEDGPTIDKSTWQGCLIDRIQTSDLDTNDVYDSTNALHKYPAIQNCRAGESGLGKVTPLTVNFSALKDAVNSMNAGGQTNMTIGVAWGMALLSKDRIPFTEGRAIAPHHRRIMILLTDGANTESRHSTTNSEIDDRTEMACDAAKTAGIEIYTVALASADTTLLEYCASSATNHMSANAAADLAGVFDTLANTIRKPRLTH